MDPKTAPGGGLKSHQTPNSLQEKPIDILYPKFLILNSTSDQLAKLSPFIIQKGLYGIGGNPKTVKKLKSGSLMIETSSSQQSKSFLNCKTLANIPISVTAHKSLNFSRGVISENDLLNVSDTEMLEELKEQNVIQVKRITIKRSEQIINTKHIILTFNSPDLPQNIKAGYLNCPVRPFIPNPLRCFNCQRFGHATTTCRGKETCSRCSAVGHSFSSCELPFKCVNCSGNHSSNFRGCPKWKEEKEIQTIRATRQLSYEEARKLVQITLPKPNLTYASATKTTTSSIAIQCNLSNENSNSHQALSSSTQTNSSTGTQIPKVNLELPLLPDENNSSTHQASSSSKPTNSSTPTHITKFNLELPPLNNSIKTKTVKTKNQPAEISNKKPKFPSRIRKPISHNMPTDEQTGSSEEGEMEVEPGLVLPNNLLPKSQKQQTNPITFP